MDPVERLFTLLPFPAERAALFSMIDLVEMALKAGRGKVVVNVSRVIEASLSATQDVPQLTSTEVEVAALLLEILRNGETSVRALIEMLHPWNTRYVAAILLGWFGPQAEPAVPALIHSASSNSPATEAAKVALLRIGADGDAVLSALRNAIEAGDEFDFRQLASLLVRMGYGAPELITVLIQAAASDNPHLREVVADTISILKQPWGPDVEALLQRLIHDSAPHVSQAALEAWEENKL
jgi:hypothetical protein